MKRFPPNDDKSRAKCSILTIQTETKNGDFNCIIKTEKLKNREISDKTFTLQTSTRKVHLERMKIEAFGVLKPETVCSQRKKRLLSATWMDVFIRNENTLVYAF